MLFMIPLTETSQTSAVDIPPACCNVCRKPYPTTSFSKDQNVSKVFYFQFTVCTGPTRLPLESKYHFSLTSVELKYLLHLLPIPWSALPPGFKQDPLPDSKPRTSLHLSLPPPNGKSSSSCSLLCVFLNGMVSRFCDVVVRYRDFVRLHGVHQGTFLGPLSISHSACPVPLCLWT